MNAAITGELRALSAHELDTVSGGTFTLDLGWASRIRPVMAVLRVA